MLEVGIILARCRRMTVSRQLGWLGVVVLGGAIWLIATRAPARGASEDTTDRSDVAPRSVRITHELINAPVVNDRVVLAPAPRRAPSPRTVTPVARRAETRPGGPSRAMKLLLGDGRHRPAPFPTVDKPPKP